MADACPDRSKSILIEGSSIVFTFNYEQEIRGVIPGNGEMSANLRVADIVSSLAMKGNVLKDRLKEKDSYDIYAVAGFHMGEPAKAAEAFLSAIKQEGWERHWAFILSGLRSIERVFESPNSRGSYAVATFVGTDSARIDAFQRVRSFLETVRKNFLFADSEHI